MRKDAPSGPMSTDVFVVRRKRKVRSGKEISSGEVGELLEGTIVTMLERAELSDGTQRARVCKAGMGGEEKETLGWISVMDTLNDCDALVAFHWMRFQRTSPNRPDWFQQQRAKSAGIDVEQLTRKLATPPPSAAPKLGRERSGGAWRSARGSRSSPSAAQDSSGGANSTRRSVTETPPPMLSSSKHTKPMGAAAEHAASFKSKSAPPSPPTNGSVSVLSEGARADTERRSSVSAGMGALKFAQKLKRNANVGNAAKEVKPSASAPAAAASQKQNQTMATYAQIQADADRLLKRADADCTKAQKSKTLTTLLGESLLEASSKHSDQEAWLAEMMRQWDPNRDGTITKMEFRQNVRKLVDKQDVKEVDKLFDKLDKDHSGELDMNECKTAIRNLQTTAKQDLQQLQIIFERANELREKASRFQAIADLTRTSEESARALTEENKKSVGAQLGVILVKKGLKVSDLVAKWGGAKGFIDKHDFRHEVNALGLSAAASDVDALFDQLDDDGGGTLDIAEVKLALRTLAEESDQVRASIKMLTTKAAEQHKAARAAQSEYRSMKEEEQKAIVEKARQREAEEEAKATAAAAAKEAKELKEAEKKAAAEKEKADFEAKIALKRAATKKNVTDKEG